MLCEFPVQRRQTLIRYYFSSCRADQSKLILPAPERVKIAIMPLPVVSFSTYVTSTDGVVWRADDYNARDFILAIEDREVAGYAFVRRSRFWKRFENANRQDVVVWFGEMVAEYCERDPPASPFVIVQVPGSKVDLGFSGLHRTMRLANEVASVLPSGPTVRDILRWDSPISSSRSVNGPRDVAFLYDQLPARTSSAAGDRVVLIDDVLALGGHLRHVRRNGGLEVRSPFLLYVPVELIGFRPRIRSPCGARHWTTSSLRAWTGSPSKRRLGR